jgi:hypothetical protein
LVRTTIVVSYWNNGAKSVNAPEVALKYFQPAGEIISKAGVPKPPVTVTCTVAELAIQVGAVVTAKLKS